MVDVTDSGRTSLHKLMHTQKEAGEKLLMGTFQTEFREVNTTQLLYNSGFLLNG